MTEYDKDLITGALDSLGVALADHQHQWTEGERAIYEESIKTLWKMAEQYRQLEQQLAAEVQTLVEALKEVNALARGNMTGCGTCNHVIDATITALAKVGK
jgi:predicted PP-loop superfamily ATPase